MKTKGIYLVSKIYERKPPSYEERFLNNKILFLKAVADLLVRYTLWGNTLSIWDESE